MFSFSFPIFLWTYTLKKCANYFPPRFISIQINIIARSRSNESPHHWNQVIRPVNELWDLQAFLSGSRFYVGFRGWRGRILSFWARKFLASKLLHGRSDRKLHDVHLSRGCRCLMESYPSKRRHLNVWSQLHRNRGSAMVNEGFLSCRSFRRSMAHRSEHGLRGQLRIKHHESTKSWMF